MKRLLAILLVTLPATVAEAQLYYDSFDAPVSSDFTAASDDWSSVWDGDRWTSALNLGAVSPQTDVNGPGAFGAPPDAFDNAIVVGEAEWNDYAVEAEFYVVDDDALGVVLRYSSADSYYLVVLSRDEMPSEGGTVDYLIAPQTRLYRVTLGGATQLLDPIPVQAYAAVSSLRQRIRVDVHGTTLTAWIGSGDEPIDTSTTPVFNITDDVPAAPESGLAGVYAFSMGEGLLGTYFDAFRVSPLDSDDDGKNNYDEISAGTDPYDADSDDDGVLDGDEYLWLGDADEDDLINALDWDSDNDGLPDGLEVGISTPHADTNVSAGHFTADADSGATTTDPLDPDSDDGGVDDGVEDINQNGAYEPDLGETDPNDGDDDDEFVDGGTDVDTDVDTDTDTDADSDTDSDGDTDSDSDSDSDTDSDLDTGADGGVNELGGLYGGPNCGCATTGSGPRASASLITLLTDLVR
jgi:hypothetical protein